MKKYYPILVAKVAELKALESLRQEVKETIAPIIEVIPEIFLDGWTEKKENAKKEADKKRVAKGLDPVDRSARKEKGYENILLTSLSTHWSFPENQVLLDFTHCNFTVPTYIWDFLEALNSKGVNVVPVICATSSQNIVDMALKFATENNKPICLRLANTFGDIDGHPIFNKLGETYNVGKDDIMLLFDGGYREDHTYEVFKKYILEKLNTLPDADIWREVIVSFGSFPKDLSDSTLVARKEPHLLKRHEWAIWNEIKNANAGGGRVRYSDYGIKHPKYEDVNFQGTASIKYTATDSFVIYKGKKSGDTELGNAQYIVHAQELVKSEYYPGEGFGWGDAMIMHYSKNSPKPAPPKKPNGKQKRPKSGAGKEWIAFGQNHHITLINSLL